MDARVALVMIVMMIALCDWGSAIIRTGFGDDPNG
jgi:hypothetical protein